MEAPKHTPAPWRAIAHLGIVTRDATAPYPADPTGGVEICRVGNWRDRELVPYNGDRWKADAHLIAAAPDMRDALRNGLAGIDAAYAACPVNSSSRSVDVCPKCGATDRQNCGLWVRAAGLMEEAARAALAKAEGQS